MSGLTNTTSRVDRHGSRGYLPTLDGWRALAIAAVCLAHSQLFTGHLRFLNFLHDYPEFGIDLFFSISGVLICSRLLDEERSTGRIGLGGFYIRRAFRILPAAYLYLFTIAGLGLMRIVQRDWSGWLASIFIYRNYVGAFHGDTPANRLTGHFWSLSIEEHFYLVFPFLLILFPRHRKLVLSLLLVLSFCWLIVYLVVTPEPLRGPAWYRRTDLRVWCLLFPALLAVLLSEVRFRKYFEALASPYLIYGAAVVEIGYRVSHWIGKQHVAAVSMSVQTAHLDMSFHPFYDLAVPLLMPIFVLCTMLHPWSMVSRFLEWRPLRAIGRISYGIYLWQQLYFGTDVESTWRIGHIPLLALGALVVSAILLSYFLVEKPLIRLGHRLAGRSTSVRSGLPS